MNHPYPSLSVFLCLCLSPSLRACVRACVRVCVCVFSGDDFTIDKFCPEIMILSTGKQFACNLFVFYGTRVGDETLASSTGCYF